jgi:hypothetical protein
MPVALKTGEVLRGRYRIRERIGQGGMGHIYLADDQRLEGRRCALKEVEHDRTVSAKMLKEARLQFLQEATVLARLDHPNLPKVSDFFSIGPRDYLVMDYVPGKDLRQRMLDAKQNNTFLAEEDVLGWANQLADALTYLHNQTPPLVHRDVKPSNMKLTQWPAETGGLWPGQSPRARRNDDHCYPGPRHRPVYSARTIWGRRSAHRHPQRPIRLRLYALPPADQYPTH